MKFAFIIIKSLLIGVIGGAMLGYDIGETVDIFFRIVGHTHTTPLWAVQLTLFGIYSGPLITCMYYFHRYKPNKS